MQYELVIVADTNDADTETQITKINQEELNELLPIFEVIKEKPERAHRYKWPTKERLTQYDSPQDIYGLTDAQVELVNEYVPYGDDEWGIHTIWSVEYYPLPTKTKLL